MNIAVHIERIVIDEALIGRDRPRLVQEAIERELARLLVQTQPNEFISGSEPQRHAALPVGASGQELGTRIAESIHRSLVPATSTTDTSP